MPTNVLTLVGPLHGGLPMRPRTWVSRRARGRKRAGAIASMRPEQRAQTIRGVAETLATIRRRTRRPRWPDAAWPPPLEALLNQAAAVAPDQPEELWYQRLAAVQLD
jgi:hypothetical protein